MAEALRLLVVGIAWPPETFLARLLWGVMEAGVEVTIACNRRPDSAWLTHPRFRWLHVPAWQGPVPLRLLRWGRVGLGALTRAPREVWRCRHTLRHWQAMSNGERGLSSSLREWNRFLPFVGRRWDVIYFPWNSAAIEHLPLFEWGIPVVVSCRGSQVNVAPHNPRRYAIREGLRRTFERASAVHCVSEAIKREAIQYGLDSAKAWVIRPAVNPKFFRPAERKPRDDTCSFRVVTTGSLIWRKGYEYALLAIRRLVDGGAPVRFEIIGDGPERQRVVYTIHDLELEHHVHLTGRLSPEEVRDRLQQADVFLLSSLSEGISNAVLEAMACGLPVVTTDCGGMREAVTDGVEGFLVPVRDSEAMAEALLTLWQDSKLRHQMGQAARDTVLRRFTLDKQIKEFVALFENAREKSHRAEAV